MNTFDKRIADLTIKDVAKIYFVVLGAQVGAAFLKGLSGRAPSSDNSET